MAQPDDDEINRIARAICENLGLDPDEKVEIAYGRRMTPQEMHETGLERPGSSSPYKDMLFRGARWETYRPQAALAIATRRALTEDFLMHSGMLDSVDEEVRAEVLAMLSKGEGAGEAP